MRGGTGASTFSAASAQMAVRHLLNGKNGVLANFPCELILLQKSVASVGRSVRPVRSAGLRFSMQVGRATSEAGGRKFVMITGRLWVDGADVEVRSVVRNAKRSLVVSPSLTFRTDVQLVQIPAKQARGRASSSANQMSPPSAFLNSLKLFERHHAAFFGAQLSRPVPDSSRCGCWSCRRPAPS